MPPTNVTSNATPALRATGLVKRFDDLVAVDGLDLEVRPETCVTLLGPNGAGRTGFRTPAPRLRVRRV